MRKKENSKNIDKINKLLEERAIGYCYDKNRILGIFKELGYPEEKTWDDFSEYMTGSTCGVAIDGEYTKKQGEAAMVPLYYHTDLKRFLLNNCNAKTYNPDY
jgi:hypothetical protein